MSTASPAARWNRASCSPTWPTWAYSGTGIWEGKPKVDKLRAIAALYPETIHLVASKALGHHLASPI